MLKNKIYKYLFNEILKNFITILLTFTAIAWVVRAVNFLDLMVEDGYASSIYFNYSVLNITTIMTRFIPLSFLLSLTVCIIRFERQQELLILWVSGLAKIKIANIFILTAGIITALQLILSLFVNPTLLNKSRSLLSDTNALNISSILKSNEFSDTFKGMTFYIKKKTNDNQLTNVFINDTNGNLKTILSEVGEQNNSIIFAERGIVDKDNLILYNGVIQTLNKKNEIKNIQFEKTELNTNDLTTRTVKLAKIQETSSSSLLRCLGNKNNNLNLKNCSSENKSEVIQALSRRLGAPLYVPLTTVIICFLLLYKKENKFNFLKKYILFILSFIILVFAEMLLKYTGISMFVASFYFVLPVIMFFLFYLLLLKKTVSEKN
jgi:lipopolysaccharide export system permease protein